MNEQETNEKYSNSAFLIDLLTKKRHPVTVPQCPVGRERIMHPEIIKDKDVLKLGVSLLWFEIQ